MGYIVAIGGGEIGRTKTLEDGSITKYPVETLEIDKFIIKLCRKENPKLLFIGTASYDDPSYLETVQNHFGKTMGLSVTSLELLNSNLSLKQIEEKILSSDIIYVGGGDTKVMLGIWREKGLVDILRKAYEHDIILSGLSAGAICWFEWYDNDDYIDNDFSKLDILPGLGFIKGAAIPHFDTLETNRKEKLLNMFQDKKIDVWAINNCAALISSNQKITIVSSKENKSAVHYLKNNHQGL